MSDRKYEFPKKMSCYWTAKIWKYYFHSWNMSITVSWATLLKDNGQKCRASVKRTSHCISLLWSLYTMADLDLFFEGRENFFCTRLPNSKIKISWITRDYQLRITKDYQRITKGFLGITMVIRGYLGLPGITMGLPWDYWGITIRLMTTVYEITTSFLPLSFLSIFKSEFHLRLALHMAYGVGTK